MYFEARYLDSDAGRFLSKDPVAQAFNSQIVLKDPQSQNAYSYSRNNPVNYVDPDGRFGVSAMLANSVVNTLSVVKNFYVPPVVNYITNSTDYRALMEQGSNEAMRNGIFNKALETTNGDNAAALLTSTAATISTNKFLNSFVAGDSLFERYGQRLINLPTDLSGEYDRYTPGRNDKNQHYFASAFLTFTFGRTIAEAAGQLFEHVESVLPSETYDQTDIEANHSGQDFAEKLKD